MSTSVRAVHIRGLRFRYPGTQQETLHISALDITGTGLIALTGPSGAGKSTLIELLAGTLREPYEGSVQVLGVELRELTRDADRQRHIRRIGLIPQDYGLLPGRTVEELLRQDLSDGQIPASEHAERIDKALLQVGLSEFAQRPSERLSGGQRQRVAIARMLARDVDMVIADEPTANLDPHLVGETLDLFRSLGARMPVIIVTHDGSVAEQCNRTIVLQAASPNEPAQVAEAGMASSSRRRGIPHLRFSALLAALISVALIASGGGVFALRNALTPQSATPKVGAASTATTVVTATPVVVRVTPTVADISLAMQTTIAEFGPQNGCPFTVLSNPLTISDGQHGTLTAVIGVCSTATADYATQLVFFWHNATFLGWDSNQAAVRIQDLSSPGLGIFAVTYPDYASNDPFCCPSLPPVTVLFHWNGSGFSANGTPPSTYSTPIVQSGGPTQGKAFTTIAP